MSNAAHAPELMAGAGLFAEGLNRDVWDGPAGKFTVGFIPDRWRVQAVVLGHTDSLLEAV